MARPRRILVVDDEKRNRKLLCAILKSLGYEAHEAEDGYEALDKLKLGFDLVLLDVMMPGMDGFEVTERIRDDPVHADIPIMMVTILTSKEDRLRAVEAGANDFITKPIDKLELRVRVASLMRMKEAGDTIKRQRARLEQEVKKRTEELRKSEKRYRTLFQDSVDAIAVITGDGSILDVNEAFVNLLGFPREDLLSVTFQDLFAN